MKAEKLLALSSGDPVIIIGGMGNIVYGNARYLSMSKYDNNYAIVECRIRGEFKKKRMHLSRIRMVGAP